MTLAELGHELKTARKARGIRLKDVEAWTGMHYSNLSLIERGLKPQVRFETIERYCDALGLEISVGHKDSTRTSHLPWQKET